ncbi:hypothetical protein ABBQ38_003610 [Trebouxia sp. C0009 RCD-2024]
MKRARESTDDPDTAIETPLDGNERVASGSLDQPAAPTTVTPVDDDPYGFGNIGAPGFVSKPSGMQSSYVPGYLRVPGSAGGGLVPAVGAAKSARTAMSGPGSKPVSAFRRGPVKPQPSAQTAAVKPLPASGPTQSSMQASVPSVSAVTEDPESAQALQRKRVQNKDLPEQHRLPEDLPLVAPGKLAKTSASASGPLSAQTKPLTKFHEEIQTFVEQSVPNQAEQLTKVVTAFFGNQL